MKKALIFISVLLIFFVTIVWLSLHKTLTKNLVPTIPTNQTTPSPKNGSNQDSETGVFAQNLEVPWAIAFLPARNASQSDAGGPNESLLITERPGRIRMIEKNGTVSEPIATIQVNAVGEGGLHGIAVDPDFDTNHYVYLYYTYQATGNNSQNRVARYKLENNKLTQDKILVDNIPGASNHDGGRIKFGPDNFLYITTGDAQEPSQAQEKGSLAGKILRVTRDGTAAPGNPFGTRVYSYGHRNPQGIAWDDKGQLWETEHGRSPGGLDELNKIDAGKNYGWPEIQGNDTRAGMVAPVVNSGTLSTWAPAGTAFVNGSIFFGGLRGSALYEYNIAENKLTEHFKNEYGRIREVVLGPDNMLYITTSNLDGRGSPKDQDDKIIKVNPDSL